MAVLAAITLSSCKDKESVNTSPKPSVEQNEFLMNTTLTSSVEGVDVLAFDFEANQFNITGNKYVVIDEFGFVKSEITLSAAPELNAVLDLTFAKEGDDSVTYSNMKVVLVQDGYVYLWRNEGKVGFMLPELR